MEYDNTPILPPPLTPICHLFLLMRLLSKKCRRRRMVNRNNDQNSTTRIFDFAMKLVLNEEEMRRLHDFEEDSVDAMTRRKLLMASLGTDNLIQKNC